MSAMPTGDAMMEAVEQPRSRRTLVLVMALVAVVGAVVAVLAGGGDPDAMLAVEASAGPSLDVPAATPVVDEEELTAIPAVTYEVFLSRDPFEPVVPEDEPTSTPVNGDQDAGTDDPDNGTTTGDDQQVGDDPSQASGEGCRGTDEVVCDGLVVSLVDILEVDGELVAVVQIDTTIYEVRKGATFAQRFVLLDVTSTTATISYVEDAFTLMVGDRVLK
jgi:hypothetical protein